MNPKTIPQFKGRIGQQVQRINPYMNRTVIPTKEIDPLIISKLLLNVSTNENNILDLKEFILKNGITTNDMLNEEGQSILHIVLSNENLSKRQKLEIVKFFRDNFTLIESFDKNGLTPLHIACRLQLTDIVKELLDAGHNINIADNVYKSPLHYAVIGRQIETPDRIDKKIFPKKKFKIKQNKINELSRELVKYINKTPQIKQFIQNQYNTIQNIDKIYLKDIQKLKDKFIEKRISISNDLKLNQDEKNIKYIKLQNEENMKIKELINSKISSGKKQINLERNTINGWGPDSNLNNTVLEYGNIVELKKQISFDENSEKTRIYGRLTEYLNGEDNLDLLLQNMNNDMEKYDEIIKELIFTYNFINDANLTINPDRKTDLTQEIKDILDNILKEKENEYYTTDISSNKIYDLNQSNIIGNVQHIENGNVSANFINVSAINKLFTDFDILFPNSIDTILDKKYDTNDYKSCNLIIKIIIHEITEIKIRLNVKLDKLIRQYLQIIGNDFINIINDILIDILSIINKIIDIENIYKKNINNLIYTFELFKTINESKSETINLNGNEHNIQILFTEILNQNDRFYSLFRNTFTEIPQKLFNGCSNYYDILNECIKYINMFHSKKYILQYFNDFKDINSILLEDINADKFFYNPVQKLNNFFKSSDDIKTKLNKNQDDLSKKENKTNLIEKYLLQMSDLNNNLFIDNTTSESGVIGFVYDLTTLDINQNELKTISTNEIKNPPLNFTKLNKIGKVQISKFDDLGLSKKSDNLIPIIENQLGDIILIQKYIITRFILSNLDTFTEDLKIIIDNMMKEIQKNNNLPEEDVGFLLIVIGKILDKIINTNLDNMINLYVSKTKQTEYNLINITEFEKSQISGIELDNLENEIYKLFKKNIKSNIYNYFDDILEKEMKKKNTYKIISSNIGDKPNEVYLEYDPSLIDLLITRGAEVNSRDKDGNTPFIIALMQTNKDVILSLLRHNISVSNKKSKNRLGFKPIDICKKIITTSIENFADSINNDMIKQFINEINDNIKKLTKINHNMRFNDIIFKMLIYLLNHDFYSKLNSYSRQQNPDFHNKFFTEITSQIKNIPLIDIEPSKMEFLSYLNPIEKLMEQKDKTEYVDKIKKYKDLRTQSIYLQNEQNLDNDLRNTEIASLQIKIEYDKTKLDTDTSRNIDDKYKKYIDDNPDKINTDKIDKILDKRIKGKYNKINIEFINKLIKQFTSKSGDIINYDILKIYEKIAEEIRNILDNEDDYRTYPLLWQNLFKNLINSDIDKTQIIDLMMNKIKNDYDNHNIIKLSSESLKLLIFDIDNYFTLPQNSTEDNYVLKRIYEIIVHIVKNIMCVNLYHIILKLIRAELINIYTNIDDIQKYESFIDSKIKVIFKKTKLKEYIFEILPQTLTKFVLNIIDEDDDKNTDITIQLKNIDRFIEQSEIYKEDTKILKIMREYVYPYFKEYFQTNIMNLKKITDGYLAMIMDLSTKLEIYDNILNKKSSENL
jgi:ankyrin repeat protein